MERQYGHTVRLVKRRGERRLVLDIVYRKPDGSLGRFHRDAEVQMLAAARAEERRRLALLVSTGSPTGGSEQPKEERMPETRTLPAFKEVAAEYLRTFAPTRLKPSTIHGYKRLLDGFLLPRIGHFRLDQVDAKVVRELDAERVKRGAKPETRRKVHIVLRSILHRFAVEAGYLESAPSMPAMPKAGAKITNTLTDEDVSRILAVAPAGHRLAFLLAAHAGLRAGEIRGLKWRDVDLAGGQLVVRESVCRGQTASPKSGHERIVRSRRSFAPLSRTHASDIATHSSLERSKGLRGASGVFVRRSRVRASAPVSSPFVCTTFATTSSPRSSDGESRRRRCRRSRAMRI